MLSFRQILGSSSACVLLALLLSLGSGCAGSVPVAAGAEKIKVVRVAPMGGGERLKELRVVHGSGCGLLGPLGNEEGAFALLRNQAQEAGADYVQITRVVVPYSDGECRHNEYIVEGVAFRTKGDGDFRIVASDAKAGKSAPASTGVLSSCPGDAPTEVDGLLRLAGGTCSYRISAQPPGAEYFVTFSARLEDGKSYTVWPGGAWNRGSVRATGIVYDVQANGLRVVRHGKPVTHALPTLSRTLDRGFHQWRVGRLRDRVVVWLDGTLILVLSGTADGGDWGVHTEGGTLEVRDVETRPLNRSEVAELRVHRVAGWQVAGSGTASTRPVTSTRPGAKRPPRVVGNCDIDAIDWKSREYPGSAVSKGKSFKLEDGTHKVTSKKTAPDPITGSTEQGTRLSFAGVVPADLDGQGSQEVVVSIGYGSYGVWLGNRPAPAEPEGAYVYRLSDACEPEFRGVADFRADDFRRFENGAMLRIYGSGNNYTVEEWRLVDDELARTGSRKAGREALDEPLKPCDEAASLANLKKYYGRRGGELLNEDPCVQRKLRERLGKKREKWEQYTSMNLSPIEDNGGYLVSGGCMSHYCGYRQAAFSVNVKTGEVEAVIVELTRDETLGAVEWFTADKRPLAALSAHFPQLVAQQQAADKKAHASQLVLPRTKYKTPLKGFHADEALARLQHGGWDCSKPSERDGWQYVVKGEDGATRLDEFYASKKNESDSTVTVTVIQYQSTQHAKRAYEDMLKKRDYNDGAKYLFGDTVVVALNRSGYSPEVAAVVSGKPVED